jgi:hypothetical protein
MAIASECGEGSGALDFDRRVLLVRPAAGRQGVTFWLDMRENQMVECGDLRNAAGSGVTKVVTGGRIAFPHKPVRAACVSHTLQHHV